MSGVYSLEYIFYSIIQDAISWHRPYIAGLKNRRLRPRLINLMEYGGGPPIHLSPNSLGQITSSGKKIYDYLKKLLPKIELCQELSNDSNKRFLGTERKAFTQFMEIYSHFIKNSETIPVADSDEY